MMTIQGQTRVTVMVKKCCKSACLTNPECVAFDFNQLTKKCFTYCRLLQGMFHDNDRDIDESTYHGIVQTEKKRNPTNVKPFI